MSLNGVTVKPSVTLAPPQLDEGGAAALLPLKVVELGFQVRGQALLEGISFELDTHATTVVLGPNGAGKTLLLRLCHGLLSPSTGKITWGRSSPGEAAARIAMVFQNPVVLRRSVLGNVTYPLRLRGVPRAQRRSRALTALERTGLAALAARPARALSGGERQRLALARAWAMEPEVLLLDEPTSNLDPQATHTVEELVRSLRASGVKILMTTHDLGQARRLADDVLFLNQGRLLRHMPVERFFNAPEHSAIEAFVRGDLLL